MSTTKADKKRTRSAVSFELADIERAKSVAGLLAERPEYKHLKPKTADVMRMAAGMGLDILERDTERVDNVPVSLAGTSARDAFAPWPELQAGK